MQTVQNLKLKSHRALVTGASSGIGEQYAHQLASLGADLVLAARREERLQKLASELRSKHHVQVDVIPTDLNTPGAALKLFEQATAGGKPVTILINNAGVGKFNEFRATPFVDIQQTMQLNMIAPTELAYAAVAHMVGLKRKCFITNVSSIGAFQPVQDFAVYTATKAYLTQWSEILDAELRGTQIRVTCLCPGGTYTEFLEHAGQLLTSTGRAGMMTAERCVQIAIKGMLGGKRLVIPGLLNWFACFYPRFLPRRIALELGTRAMRMGVNRTPS